MRRSAAWALAAVCLAGCGQKGALYLPDAGGEVVTRPTQTPADAPAPGAPTPAAPAAEEKPAEIPPPSPR